MSAEVKLEQIRVKKLKFTLKGCNYEDAKEAGLSSEFICYLSGGVGGEGS